MKRYTKRPFPAYRHRPGVTPHPERNPKGHSYARSGPRSRPLRPGEWRDNPDYLYGVDLFNAGYFWEAHEAWERLWKLADPDGSVARFLQGLIQLAAACLKKRVGRDEGAEKLLEASLAKLRRVSSETGATCFLGVDLDALTRTARSEVDRGEAPPLELHDG